MSKNPHNNPYLEKFAKVFTTGLYISVFIGLIFLTVFYTVKAKADMEVQPVPALCGPYQNLIVDIQEGRLSPVVTEEVIIFTPRGSGTVSYVKTVDKYNNTYHTIIDSEGLACLLFVQKGKESESN